MLEIKKYDVIVVGAGPAGLSVASELSKELKVLVVDGKSSISKTTKSWFVPKEVCDIGEAGDILEYTYPGVKRFLADTFTGVKDKAWESELEGGYLYIKEHEVLEYWGEIITKNSSEILLECNYLDHQVEKEKEYPVTIHTTKGNFESKLLVDASGYDSLIREKYHLKDEKLYWWSVYGAIMKHKDGIPQDMKVGDYMFWQTFKNTNPDVSTSLNEGRPVFEYEVLDENSSFPLILFLKDSQVSFDIMKDTFNEVMKEKKVMSKYNDCEIQEIKYGWYPSGGVSQYIAEDNVTFVGDAACWTTPCGWGFAFIVKNYKRYARNLITAFEKNEFDKDTLDSLIGLKTDEKFQILFNKVATRILSIGDTELLDKIILLFNKIGFIYCEKTFTLTITTEDIISIIVELIKNLEFDILKKIFTVEDIKWLKEELSDKLEGTVSRIIDSIEKIM
ncbi:lycopene cyclase family protein [Haliovirga abyssi]|uniref:NAD(P)/FAD-dependent oxidoreductase n=1 Tax=Haliovirga abyssi TaxID=2996794 RepID=A0AAU9DML6_9FUSO|nr:lycopene cyclase family protein [Haliovirga abyssi]BDU51267.1 hypothetical protein HLVA_18360 [Haliovirga abyssi]